MYTEELGISVVGFLVVGMAAIIMAFLGWKLSIVLTIIVATILLISGEQWYVIIAFFYIFWLLVSSIISGYNFWNLKGKTKKTFEDIVGYSWLFLFVFIILGFIIAIVKGLICG